ncbi:hypothetical protein [Bradyrhizobium sp. AS23.2]|uniref:hypothetical protein n=1 Tax=Bradyrhizobium sp. AS23.2 TaxID=1680155 RepID=UPI0011610A84|nr:hypothetical protein [Bradyrhizobium sp. AS23.2]
MGEKLGHEDVNPVDPHQPKRIAIVVSNAAISGNTGWPVGFWWSELTHTFHMFIERGYEVEVFSPNGGRCEADPMSDPRDESRWSAGDLISMGFIHTPEYVRLVEETRPAREIELDNFDAIVVAGGQGPMFTFEQEKDLQDKFVAFNPVRLQPRGLQVLPRNVVIAFERSDSEEADRSLSDNLAARAMRDPDVPRHASTSRCGSVRRISRKVTRGAAGRRRNHPASSLERIRDSPS